MNGIGTLPMKVGGVERIAGQLRRRGKAFVADGNAGRGRAGEGVAREIGRGAIGGQALLDVAVQRPGGQLHGVEFMVDLARKFEGFHVVGRADVRIVTELVVVDILVEGRVHAGEIGQVEAGVEVDRRARQLGIAALEIEGRVVAGLGDDAAVEAVIFLVIDGLGIAEEFVAPEAIGGAIIGRQHKADIVADRAGDIGAGFAGGEFAIAAP